MIITTNNNMNTSCSDDLWIAQYFFPYFFIINKIKVNKEMIKGICLKYKSSFMYLM